MSQPFRWIDFTPFVIALVIVSWGVYYLNHLPAPRQRPQIEYTIIAPNGIFTDYNCYIVQSGLACKNRAYQGNLTVSPTPRY